MGDIIFPNNIPNLNHTLFNGVSIFDFKIPNIKKIIETIKAQYLNSFSSNKGQIEIIKKTTKKTIPKLLLEPILILFCFKF